VAASLEEAPGALDEVRFVLFRDADLDTYAEALADLGSEAGG
jgi:hypothetical protein